MFYHSHILTWFPCFLNYSQPQYSYFEAKNIHFKICKKMFSSIQSENAIEKWHERKKKFTKPHNYLRRDAELRFSITILCYISWLSLFTFSHRKFVRNYIFMAKTIQGEARKGDGNRLTMSFRTTNRRNLSKAETTVQNVELRFQTFTETAFPMPSLDIEQFHIFKSIFFVFYILIN